MREINDDLGPVPCCRMGHAAILVGTNLVIQGGFKFEESSYKQSGKEHGTYLQNCYLNDVRVLDTETLVWSRLRVSGTPPIPRYGHTLDVSDSDIIMFGGWTLQSGKKSSNETTGETCAYFLVLNTETMSWSNGKYFRQAPTSNLNSYIQI